MHDNATKIFEKENDCSNAVDSRKIAIARALYKDAPFMILDEPTAVLDSIAETGICSKFDKIAVFGEGWIVQRGSH